jgi:hypothetical protein
LKDDLWVHFQDHPRPIDTDVMLTWGQ